MTKKRLALCTLGWMLVIITMGCGGLSATPTPTQPAPEPAPAQIPVSPNLDSPVTLESELVRYTVSEVFIAGNSFGERGVVVRIPPDHPDYYLLVLHVSAENLTGEQILAGHVTPGAILRLADAPGNDLDCVAVCGMGSSDRDTCQNLLGFLVDPGGTSDAYLVFLIPNDVDQFMLSIR